MAERDRQMNRQNLYCVFISYVYDRHSQTSLLNGISSLERIVGRKETKAKNNTICGHIDELFYKNINTH